MYCILVTGIPAAGKSRMAQALAEHFQLPAFSKDKFKELLYDRIGFSSREEKVRLGAAAMDILYETAEGLMKCGQPFILENNFENASKEGIFSLLERYSYRAVTLILTGDYEKIYQRFLLRNESPERHRGHVVNDCYPEKCPGQAAAAISYETFVAGITARGMDSFRANGPQIVLDTTDFSKVDMEQVFARIETQIAVVKKKQP